MQRKSNLFRVLRSTVILSICVFFFSQCSPEPDPEPYNVLELTASAASSCGCNYVVPVSSATTYVDAQQKGIKPGGVICLEGGKTYGPIVFKNVRGTASAPITIKNCGGTVTVNGVGKSYSIRTESSSYFRITGGSSGYGIKVNGGHMSVTFDKRSTNIELDHVEVYGSGFAGVVAKTDPACDGLGVRGSFTMRDLKFHDNYIHDTAGEGFYVGNSFWLGGVNTPCGKKYPHAVEYAKIYNNLIRNAGWEAIQLGSSPIGSEIYGNRIENYGTKNVNAQNNGIQLGEGTVAKTYGNFIKGGKGTGIILIGNGKNLVHNNVIINAGQDGIFCDDRVYGEGFVFTNNTIIRPGLNGIRLYADQVTMSKIQNNIIIAPGNYNKLVYPRKKEEAYVYKLSSAVKVQVLNNYQSLDINAPKFAGAYSDNFALTSSSTAVLNKGTSISAYGIPVDYAKKTRIKGTAVDIGAYELQ
jgi:hypothetical protein